MYGAVMAISVKRFCIHAIQPDCSMPQATRLSGSLLFTCKMLESHSFTFSRLDSTHATCSLHAHMALRNAAGLSLALLIEVACTEW